MSEPAQPFVQALAAFRDGLAQAGAPFTFIGGVAVVAAGVTRYTVDIDATILAPGVPPERILATLARFGIRPRIPDALSFTEERQVPLLEHTPTGVELDLSLAWLPFEEEAIARSEETDFGGEPIRVTIPEDLVVYKIVAGRPQDLADVNSLLLLHGDSFRLERLRGLVATFAQVLEAPELSETLEDALREAGLPG